MGIIGEKLEVDFVISTGDNFYDRGLKGTEDPAFEESFSKVYTAPSLQTEWYSGKNRSPSIQKIYIYIFRTKLLLILIN